MGRDDTSLKSQCPPELAKRLILMPLRHVPLANVALKLWCARHFSSVNLNARANRLLAGVSAYAPPCQRQEKAVKQAPAKVRAFTLWSSLWQGPLDGQWTASG